MNIFFLAECPEAAARRQVRKSAVKMVLESAQLLSTALRLRNAAEVDLSRTYKLTHRNHPSAVWLRRSRHHFDWLVTHALELCRMFRERSGVAHKSQPVIDYCGTFARLLPRRPFALEAGDLAILSTEAGQAAHRRFLESDQTFPQAVLAYREFYEAKPYVIDARRKGERP